MHSYAMTVASCLAKIYCYICVFDEYAYMYGKCVIILCAKQPRRITRPGLAEYAYFSDVYVIYYTQININTRFHIVRVFQTISLLTAS